MITVYDFESTDFVDFKMRSADPAQPHIVSMGLITYAEDGTEISRRLVFTKPDGWESKPDALRTHGHTTEFLMEHGIPEDHVIALWVIAMARAVLRIGFNEHFDRRLARIAMTRAGYQRDFIETMEARPSHCVMQESRKHFKLPPTHKMLAANMKAPKTPSLAETIQYFFNEEFTNEQGAHGALRDCEQTGRLYWHMKTLPTVV